MSERDELRAAADAFTRGKTFYEGMPLTNGARLVAGLREALDDALAVIEQIRAASKAPLHWAEYGTEVDHIIATSPPDALDAVKREAAAVALEEYAVALEKNPSADYWQGGELFVNDIREWAASTTTRNPRAPGEETT